MNEELLRVERLLRDEVVKLGRSDIEVRMLAITAEDRNPTFVITTPVAIREGSVAHEDARLLPEEELRELLRAHLREAFVPLEE